MTRLFLHVGWPKTGSTFISDVLQANEEILEKNGLKVYTHLFKEGATDELDYMSDPAQFDAIKLKIQSLIKAARTDENILISKECWSSFSDETFQSIIDGAGETPIKVIVYLRRQDDFAESAWKQWHHKQWTLEEWKDFLVKKKNLYLPRLKLWAGLFGKENIIVRRYGKSYFKNGIVRDLLDCIEVPELELDYGTGVSNPSLDRNSLEILYRTRNLANGIHDNRMLNIFERHTVTSGKAFSRKPLYSSAHRKEILDSFQEENSIIASTFLDQGSTLFPDILISDEPEELKSDNELLQECMKIILAQEEEIKDFRKNNQPLHFQETKGFFSTIKAVLKI
jgi:hypothetical protein